MSGGKNHYVDNKKLVAHLTERRRLIKLATEQGTEPPALQNDRYLGEVILAIATNLAYRPNFINYSFKEEMIGDAIENLLKAVDNFNPEKSSLAFTYMTSVAWNAFVRRIESEANVQRLKGDLIDHMMIDDMFDAQDHDVDGIAYKTHFVEYLRENNLLERTPRKTKKKKEPKTPTLGEFMEPDVEVGE